MCFGDSEMAEEEKGNIIMDDDDEDDDIDDSDIIKQSDEELEEEREEIKKLGLDNESNRAFHRIFNKEDQNPEKKKDKKDAPDYFMPK